MDDNDDDICWEDLHKPTYLFYSGLFVLSYETVFYPLECLKTRQQFARESLTTSSIAMDIYRNEGMRGFFRGFGAALCGSLPGQMAYFGSYELAKHACFRIAEHLSFPVLTTNNQAAQTRSGTTSSSSRFISNLFAGFFADMVCLLVHTPADIIAQRHMIATAKLPLNLSVNIPERASMNSRVPHLHSNPSLFAIVSGNTQAVETQIKQISSVSASNHHPTTQQLFREIVRYEGVRGLYRGYWASVVTYAPSSAIWFAMYELSKFELSARCPSISKEDPTMNHLISGATSGFVATVLMNPFDVAKTRLQTLDARVAADVEMIRRGFFAMMAWTVKNEGVTALLKGLGPRLWFSVPGSAITFAGYEWAKSMASFRNDD